MYQKLFSFRAYTNLKIKQLPPPQWLTFYPNFKSSFILWHWLSAHGSYLLFVLFHLFHADIHVCMVFNHIQKLFRIFRSPHCLHEVMLFNHFSVIHFCDGASPKIEWHQWYHPFILQLIFCLVWHYCYSDDMDMLILFFFLSCSLYQERDLLHQRKTEQLLRKIPTFHFRFLLQ